RGRAAAVSRALPNRNAAALSCSILAVAALFACSDGGEEPPGPSPDPAGNAESPADAPASSAALSMEPALLKRVLRLSPVPPVPVDPTNRVSGNEAAAELGRHLFHSRKLSKGERISCAVCHDPRDSFVDGKKVAVGVLPLERHSPTLWNVAHQRWFFWDGRADSLWAQALVPIEDPLEHAFTRAGVAKAIHGDAQLRERYEAVFGPMPPLDNEERFPAEARPVPPDDRAHKLAAAHAQKARRSAKEAGGGQGHHTHLYGTGFYHPHQRAWDSMEKADQDAVTTVFVNSGKAIAAFQERMVSARSPFDEFVEGLRGGHADRITAFEPAALRGLKLFAGKAQCIVCHHGPLFTDYEFHDTQVPAPEDPNWVLTHGEELPEEGSFDGGLTSDLGRVHGIERLRASEFGVASRWSDDPDGPARVKVDYLPTHLHEGSPEFKTPTLRNVALTPPYMHNGAFDTLEEVVRFYNTREGARRFGGQAERILQPLGLTAAEESDLVAFLESLSDDSLDMARVRAPR
ncbi:MAG: cytochrome c peroxidase, partial [Planctomycetota bacterium]